MDLVYCCAALLPLRLVLSGMKEVTRTWKVLGGVTQAYSRYKDSLLVMIAIGWAKGQLSGGVHMWICVSVLFLYYDNIIL